MDINIREKLFRHKKTVVLIGLIVLIIGSALLSVNIFAETPADCIGTNINTKHCCSCLAITASPGSISGGDSSTLTLFLDNNPNAPFFACSPNGFSSGDGTAVCSIDNGVLPSTTFNDGSYNYSVSPANTTTYTASCSGIGGTKTDSVTITIINNPPSPINLSVSQPDYCLVSWAVAIFSWKFTDLDGDSQSAYQIQVDNNSNFSSSEVDTGKVPSVIPNNSYGSYATLPGKLSWNTTYYWRVKVWDSKDLSSSWISGPSFTTPVHAYPSIDFSWNPQNPATNEIVQFIDGSTVFGGATKQSWLWTFQDGSPANSSIQNATTTFTSPDSKNVSLRVRDSSDFECTGSKSFNIRLPLPEYHEVPPTIWLKKFFAGIINFFDGFLKI